VARTKDKAASGRPFQKEMRSGAWMFDTTASWYSEYKAELLDFTVGVEAVLDDQFDSTVNLALGLVGLHMEEGDDRTDDEEAFERESARMDARSHDGRSQVTGY
jgi:hypothetical protein